MIDELNFSIENSIVKKFSIKKNCSKIFLTIFSKIKLLMIL